MAPSLAGAYAAGSGSYTFFGQAQPGALVWVTDATGGGPWGPVAAGPTGAYSLNAAATLAAGDLLQAHAGSVNGPASSVQTVGPGPAFAAVLVGGPWSTGAGMVTVQGAGGQWAVVFDAATGLCLGQGALPASGTGALFYQPSLLGGQTLKVTVGGFNGPSFSPGAAVGAPVALSGAALTDGSTLYLAGAPGALIQVVDAAGDLLGSATVNAGGQAAVAVVGGRTGSALYAAQDGVLAPLGSPSMAQGAQPMILDRNIFRPGRDRLAIVLKSTVDDHVKVRAYTLAGSVVELIAEQDLLAGAASTVYWDGRNAQGQTVASGVYFITVHGGSVRSVKKLIVVK
jgi:hypothetical protein